MNTSDKSTTFMILPPEATVSPFCATKYWMRPSRGATISVSDSSASMRSIVALTAFTFDFAPTTCASTAFIDASAVSTCARAAAKVATAACTLARSSSNCCLEAAPSLANTSERATRRLAASNSVLRCATLAMAACLSLLPICTCACVVNTALLACSNCALASFNWASKAWALILANTCPALTKSPSFTKMSSTLPPILADKSISVASMRPLPLAKPA